MAIKAQIVSIVTQTHSLMLQFHSVATFKELRQPARRGKRTVRCTMCAAGIGAHGFYKAIRFLRKQSDRTGSVVKSVLVKSDSWEGWGCSTIKLSPNKSLILKVFFASFLKSCKKTLTDATRWAEKSILARTKGLVRPELVTGGCVCQLTSKPVKAARPGCSFNILPYGQWNAIFTASFIPTFMVFELLCRRFPLKTLLWARTVVAVPQLIPLLFIYSVTGALLAAVPVGLMGGVAIAAYLDLIIRSCPSGLQGTTLMRAGRSSDR